MAIDLRSVLEWAAQPSVAQAIGGMGAAYAPAGSPPRVLYESVAQPMIQSWAADRARAEAEKEAKRKKKKGRIKKGIGTAVGATAGFIVGGPAGAVVGAKLGSGIGGSIGGPQGVYPEDALVKALMMGGGGASQGGGYPKFPPGYDNLTALQGLPAAPLADVPGPGPMGGDPMGALISNWSTTPYGGGGYQQPAKRSHQVKGPDGVEYIIVD